MIKKLKAVFALFQLGSVVADPAKWKARQISATVISSLIWAGLKLGGLDDQIGSETVDAVAIGVIALVNGVLTITTSATVGVPVKRKSDHQ